MNSTFNLIFNSTLNADFACSKSYFVLKRLEHWFCFKKAGFYKFLEPCQHRAYKPGDSWTEELGFCRKTFNAAFDLIGIRYKSKTAFLAAEDKFKGKLYASYYDRDTNQMFYVRNHDFVEPFLKSLFKPKKPKPCRSQNMKPQEPQTQEISKTPLPVRTGKNCRSDGGTIGGYINIPSFLQKNTALATPSLENPTDEVEEMKKTAEEMKRIWLDEIGDLGIKYLSPAFVAQLTRVFNTHFHQSWERWQDYCRLIASSKFLMGEGKNQKFKVWINWAIKTDVIERVKAGEFGLGDRKTKADQERDRQWGAYQQLQEKQQEIKEQVHALDCHVSQQRFQAAQAHLATLTPAATAAMRRQFDQEWASRQAVSPQRGQAKEYAWEPFKRQYALQELGRLSAEAELQQAAEQAGLLSALQRISRRFSPGSFTELHCSPVWT